MVADGTSADGSWREGLVAHPGWRCEVYFSAGLAADRVQALADTGRLMIAATPNRFWDAW